SPTPSISIRAASTPSAPLPEARPMIQRLDTWETRELRRQFQRLGQAETGLNETFEELHVEGRSSFRFGVPLDADAEPVGIDGFDCLDDPIGCESCDAQPSANALDGLVMRAIDADFAAAIDLVEASAHFKQHGVAMRTAGIIAM